MTAVRESVSYASNYYGKLRDGKQDSHEKIYLYDERQLRV